MEIETFSIDVFNLMVMLVLLDVNHTLFRCFLFDDFIISRNNHIYPFYVRSDGFFFQFQIRNLANINKFADTFGGFLLCHLHCVISNESEHHQKSTLNSIHSHFFLTFSIYFEQQQQMITQNESLR